MTPDRSSRRNFLRRGAAVALAAATAGCRFRGESATGTPPETEGWPGTDSVAGSGTPSPDRLRRAYGDRFDEVVNVAAAGAAADASEPIDPVLDRVVADDTLVYFPPGSYAVRSFTARDVANAGLVSDGADATRIVPASPATDIGHLFLQFLGVRSFLLSGFTLDFREPGRGGVTRVVSGGAFDVRDCRIAGKMPDRSLPDNPAAFTFAVRDAAATGRVRNLALPDGGHDGGNAIGLYVDKDHAGVLRFEDCVVEDFPNNGLYASAPGRDMPGYRGADGTVHVVGGRYRNNNIANVRVGTTDSTVRGARIVVDRVPPSPDDALNARGLRLRGKHGQVVEDCEIVLGEDAGYGFGALVIHTDSGRATVRDTSIRVDADDRHAVNVLPLTATGLPTGSTFENVTVDGAASGGTVVSVREREGLTVRDCEIRGTGRNRDGLSFEGCRDCSVEDTTVDVTGRPVRTVDSTVETANLALGGDASD